MDCKYLGSFGNFLAWTDFQIISQASDVHILVKQDKISDLLCPLEYFLEQVRNVLFLYHIQYHSKESYHPLARRESRRAETGFS